MPRKGSRKVRTGCITCKVRKVKCDETKPACVRCMKTGRRCNGYVPSSQDAASLQQLNQVFPEVGQVSEGRALQYFREVAGPAMSGAVDPYFWTHVAMQFSTFEPAVKHAIISISSLYEKGQSAHKLGDEMRHTKQPITLRHYNAAIRELRAMVTEDKLPIILLVCVLFICIEIMRSNRKGALLHSRHGVEILKSICVKRSPPWVIEHLLPIFRRLSEFTLFFGDQNSDVPDIRELGGPMPPSFSSDSDAQIMLDIIFNRTAQFIRSLQIAKQSWNVDTLQQDQTGNALVTSERLVEQIAIQRLLDQWLKLFVDFTSIMPKNTATPEHIQRRLGNRIKTLRCFLRTRYECCRIWVGMAFDTSEAGYGRYVGNFQRALDQLLRLEVEVPGPSRMASRHPVFIFEAGFVAILFFLAYACPRLETRLEFLRLMPVLGQPREALWELAVLVAAVRRKIELEHGVKFANDDRPIFYPNNVTPKDYPRKIDIWKDSQAQENLYVDDRGTSTRSIKLMKHDHTGQTYPQRDYVVIDGRILG